MADAPLLPTATAAAFDPDAFDAALRAKVEANPALGLPLVALGLASLALAIAGVVLLVRAWLRRAEEGRTPGPPEPPAWGPVEAILAIGATVFFNVVLGGALRLERPSLGAAGLVLPAVAANAGGVALIVLLARLRGQGLRALGVAAGRESPVRTGLHDLVLAFPLYYGLNLLTKALFHHLDRPIHPNAAVAVFLTTDSVADLAVIAAVAIVAAPVLEETIFRGFLYPALRAAGGRSAAIGISAALFALLHPPVDMPAIFVLGAALAIAYERSGSLAAPILAHVLNNAWGVLMLCVQRYVARA